MSDAEKDIDRSEAADAARFRWLIAGNSYWLEEWGVAGHGPGEEDDARELIDEWMKDPPIVAPAEPRVTRIDLGPPRPLSEEDMAEIAEQALALGLDPSAMAWTIRCAPTHHAL
jgi:hypothetical protein